MPRYKVALHRRIRRTYAARPEPNPFLAPMPAPGATHSMAVREWTFEAKDEAHVLELLEEAQAMGVPGVQGFTLRSIEEVK